MGKQSAQSLAIKRAKQKVREYTIIITLLIVLALCLKAFSDDNYSIIQNLLYVLPFIPALYIIMNKVIVYEEKIKLNILLENEEFYQTETGILNVQPLEDFGEYSDTFDKAKFIAKQTEKNTVEVYIMSKNESDKTYKKPQLYDVLEEGHLLLNYRVIN